MSKGSTAEATIELLFSQSGRRDLTGKPRAQRAAAAEARGPDAKRRAMRLAV